MYGVLLLVAGCGGSVGAGRLWRVSAVLSVCVLLRATVDRLHVDVIVWTSPPCI